MTSVLTRDQSPPHTSESRAAATEANKAHTGGIGEDWLAVILGTALIAAVLAGLRIALPATSWSNAQDLIGTVLAFENIQRLLIACVLVVLVSGAAAVALGADLSKFVVGAAVLFGLAWLAQVAAGHATMRIWGLEYVVFALAIGLAISNVIGVPNWLAEAARAEFYIKIGLVLLGASILFDDLVKAGLLGIAQGLLVVLVVWFFAFRLAKRLGVDDELAVMLSSAVSICGVSAAIAACGAIQGDRRKLSYVTSLVLIVAVPMIVAMPRLVVLLGIPEVVGGAWLGGTLDTSASVVAAGEMVGPAARDAGVVVKLSQNVLIGVAAFLLTVWWTVRNSQNVSAPGVRVIWERFPKFVLGFLVVSLVFSFVVDPARVATTRSALTGLRTVWFALAFTSIGLETRFTELVNAQEGRPALAFVGAQAFNVLWTLILAYVFFGGLLFPTPLFD